VVVGFFCHNFRPGAAPVRNCVSDQNSAFYANMFAEKEHVRPIDEEVAPDDHDDSLNNPAGLPLGWNYRQRRLFGLTIPGYTSPSFQLVLVAFVCFLCPGMFNALGGLGGGGKTDATLGDNMVRREFRGGKAQNQELIISRWTEYCSLQYICSFRFFGGTFVNKLGVKWTLAFGGIGYCIYAISLLSQFTQVSLASTSSPVLCSVFVPAFSGLPKAP
jgi:hypothetical protein